MYYECCDIKYIFHVMRLLHLVHWIQSVHFVYFEHKFRPLKIPYIPNRWDIQDNKLNKEEQTRAKYLYFVIQHVLLCLYTHVWNNH